MNSPDLALDNHDRDRENHPDLGRIIDPKHLTLLDEVVDNGQHRLSELLKRHGKIAEPLMERFGQLLENASRLSEYLDDVLGQAGYQNDAGRILQNILQPAVAWAENQRFEYPDDNPDYDPPFPLPSDLHLFYIHPIESFLGQAERSIDGFVKYQYYFERFWRETEPSTTKSDLITPEKVAAGQEKIMQSLNLNEYEKRTADASVTLHYLLQGLLETSDADILRLLRHQSPAREKLVLDLGCGTGRLDIALALTGRFKINGIDLSSEVLEQAGQRVANIAGPAGQDQVLGDLDTAVGSLWASRQKRIGRLDIDRQRLELSDRLSLKKASFFELNREKYQELFGNRLADAVTITWHTFGFAGDRSGQLQVLANAIDNLEQGGRILIEMPDRELGEYGRVAESYHRQSGGKTPLGVVVDRPAGKGSVSNPDSEGAPRYFPSKAEMFSVLKEAGFEKVGCQSYYIRIRDNGKERLIKEILYTAQKPLAAGDSEKEAILTYRLRNPNSFDALPSELE